MSMVVLNYQFKVKTRTYSTSWVVVMMSKRHQEMEDVEDAVEEEEVEKTEEVSNREAAEGRTLGRPSRRLMMISPHYE